MFPIIAIAGVIGAVASVAKGADWAAEKLAAIRADRTPAEKTSGNAKLDAAKSGFEQALAAQAAGQAMPSSAVAASGKTAPAAVVPVSHGTDYDSLARIRAGVAAYGHVGERREDHGWPTRPPSSTEDRLPPVAGLPARDAAVRAAD